MLPAALCLMVFLAPPPAAPAPQVQATRLEPTWSSPLGGLRDTTLVGARHVGELLLVEDGRHGVTALDPATGEPVWFVQLPDALEHWPVAGPALVFAAGTAQVVVDARTGSRLATRRAATIAATSPTSDGRLVFVPSLLGDQLVVHDMRTGLQAWQMGMTRPFASSALLVGSDMRRSVVFATEDGALHALAATADVPRTERWVAPVGRPVGDPIPHGELLLLATDRWAVAALSTAAGDVQWKQLPGEPIVAPPVVLGERVFAATPTRLLAFGVPDGAPTWTRTDAFVPLGPVAGLLLVRADDDRCLVLDPADGRTRLDGLPADLQPAGPVAVAVRGATVQAWGSP